MGHDVIIDKFLISLYTVYKNTVFKINIESVWLHILKIFEMQVRS